PLLGDVDIAVVLPGGFVVLAQIVPRDAAGEALVADLGVEESRAPTAGDRFHRLHLDHRALDVAIDFLVVLVLVVMRIDVDDQEVLIVSLPRLLARVLERLRLGELVVVQIADFFAGHIHGNVLKLAYCVARDLFRKPVPTFRDHALFQITTKMSSPRRTTSYLRSFSLRSPAHSPVLMSYS